MSNYENYNSVSESYDDYRMAKGSGLMAAMIQFQCGKPLKDLHVLDAGCGTGNYALDLINHGVGHMSLFDACPGMLEKARVKLSKHIETGRIKNVVEAKLPQIPFKDNMFDAVLLCTVMHHVETGEGDKDFKKSIETLKEARRVLQPGGLILISTNLPETLRTAIWFMQINMDVTDRILRRFPHVEEWENIFDQSGLKCIQKINLLGNDLMRDYQNFEGPLYEEWRKASSYWAAATDEELEGIKTFILDLKNKGELESWCKSRDHIETTGCLTLFALTPLK